jgi:hypothetical protein
MHRSSHPDDCHLKKHQPQKKLQLMILVPGTMEVEHLHIRGSAMFCAIRTTLDEFLPEGIRAGLPFPYCDR